MNNIIVVGAGFAGSTIARILAENGNRVILVEDRDHIGGNMFDYKDSSGVYIHKYGPHIFHTNSDEVVDFLKRFSDFFEYRHEVLGLIDKKLVCIPFNLSSLEALYDSDNSKRIKEILINTFGMDKKIPINVLRKHADTQIKEFADYVYKKVFLNYTKKQWGMLPDELDMSVTSRVPVYISYDIKYFQDKYQIMPSNGYTTIFNNLIDHPNIELKLNCNANNYIKINQGKSVILYDGKVFNGILVYTGCIDELFNYKFGQLNYRSLQFKFETFDYEYYQPSAVVNYPNDNDYTRITEFKHFTVPNIKSSKTTIAIEYPCEYNKDNIPYYPIPQEKNNEIYAKYKAESKKYKNLYLVGRLAEYKYYNMDQVVLHSINTAHKIMEDLKKAEY